MAIIGFDCNTKLSYKMARKFKIIDMNFVIRYVGRYKMNTKIDIDKIEKNNILKAGLDLGIVQHCPGKPGIIPSGKLGKTWGINAREFSKKVEYKKDCIVYLDLENVNIKFKNKQQLIYDYINYWAEEVIKYYTPGIYVGYNGFMSSQQLYYKLKFIMDYWKSCSFVPNIYRRGYAMKQEAHSPMFGIPIDKNTLTGDKLGRFPQFMKGQIFVDPKKDIRDAARKILTDELKLGFSYWDNVKYFDELLYKLGVLFKDWKKF